MKLPLISTILEEASKRKTKKERVQFLRSHHPNKTMLRLLKYTFDPEIKFALPEGDPPYKENDIIDEDMSGLYQEDRRMYLFIEGGNPNLHPIRRETLFIQMLESVNPKEAKLMLAVKNKKLPYKGITKEVVKEAFPNLL